MDEAIRQLQHLADNARTQAYDYADGTDQQRAYQLGSLAAYSDAVRIVTKYKKAAEVAPSDGKEK
ncbi:hypothetical protein [Lacticaseibacillus brantae]|uniref:hypothetical protein n=1 Tax=Lacticaseibacillus brantae TaxID=943673 RepID=UPI00070A6714|nr:hypothetical protein [Lacticaseibacillus brantae]